MKDKNMIINTILTPFKDSFMFPAFEIFIVLLLIYGFYKEASGRKSGRSVTRGDESIKNFYHFFVFFLSLLISVVISITETIKNYKIIVYFLNLTAVLYLCFFNNWFRNKIIGMISLMKDKIKSKKENQ